MWLKNLEKEHSCLEREMFQTCALGGIYIDRDKTFSNSQDCLVFSFLEKPIRTLPCGSWYKEDKNKEPPEYRNRNNIILSETFREQFPEHLTWALKDELDFPRLERKEVVFLKGSIIIFSVVHLSMS